MSLALAATAKPSSAHPRRSAATRSEVKLLAKPNRRQLEHIPGRAGVPILGILPEAARNPRSFGERMVSRYGRVHRFYASGNWNVQLVGPEANELVLFDAAAQFSAYGGWRPVVEPFFPEALIIKDGDDHRVSRRILGEAFKPEQMAGYRQIFGRDIAAAVDGWVGREVDAYAAVKQLTMDVATSTFLGLSLGSESAGAVSDFAKLMGALVAVVPNPWLSPAAARGLAGKRRLQRTIEQLIPTRRARPGKDIFSRICHLRIEDGSLLPESTIVESTIFLLAAAHDTLASGFTSVLYYLARHPEWVEQLREDLDDAGIGASQEAAAADLPHFDMMFKEALRLNAAAPIIWRQALRDIVFQGYRTPAGTVTGVNPMMAHVLPDVWPEPERFDPLRFTPEAERSRHKFAFVPFGGGIHKCLGLHFSMQQARTFMAELVRRADLSLVNQAPVGWYHWPNCRPLGSLQVRLSARLR